MVLCEAEFCLDPLVDDDADVIEGVNGNAGDELSLSIENVIHGFTVLFPTRVNSSVGLALEVKCEVHLVLLEIIRFRLASYL